MDEKEVEEYDGKVMDKRKWRNMMGRLWIKGSLVGVGRERRPDKFLFFSFLVPQQFLFYFYQLFSVTERKDYSVSLRLMVSFSNKPEF